MVLKVKEDQPVEVVIQDQVVEEEEDMVLECHLQDLALLVVQTLVVVVVVQHPLEIQVVVVTLVDLAL